MGCHTWSYRKIDLTDEQIQEIKTEALNKIDKYFNSSEEAIKAEYNKENEDWYNEFNEPLNYSLEEYVEGFKQWKEYIHKYNIKERIENNDFSYIDGLADTSKYSDKDRCIGLLFYDGNWYEPIYQHEDLFRITGYPDDKFTDSQKLIEWLKTRDSVSYWNGKKEVYGFDKTLEKKIIDAFNETSGLLFEFG